MQPSILSWTAPLSLVIALTATTYFEGKVIGMHSFFNDNQKVSLLHCTFVCNDVFQISKGGATKLGVYIALRTRNGHVHV